MHRFVAMLLVHHSSGTLKTQCQRCSKCDRSLFAPHKSYIWICFRVIAGAKIFPALFNKCLQLRETVPKHLPDLNITPPRFFSSCLVSDPNALGQHGPDHALIGGVVAVVVFITLCLIIVLGRYLARHKGKRGHSKCAE